MKTLLASLVLVVISSFSFAQDETALRSVPWGSSVSSLPFSMSLYESGPQSYYVRDGESLSIGSATVDGIYYGFYKDQFSTAYIPFTGYLNFDFLLSTLSAKYGEPYQGNEYLDEYNWWGDVVSISLDYSDITEEGSIWYFYEPIVDQQSADEENTAAGAVDGL